MACMLDVIAPKPGNVHRGADFEDATFLDFAASAVAIAPAIGKSAHTPLGLTILNAVRATREVTSTNTNLGIILMLAPIAAVVDSPKRETAVEELISNATEDDMRNIYEAIRLARPGGLGDVEQGDVNSASDHPLQLREAMELAQDRDRIAEMYATNFRQFFREIIPALVVQCREHGVIQGLIQTHVELLAAMTDTLIKRKCGAEIATEASHRARQVTAAVGSEAWYRQLSDLDFWLRSDGNRRNPGTTADLLTAAMFTALYEKTVKLSFS